jgi:hypothetical protein
MKPALKPEPCAQVEVEVLAEEVATAREQLAAAEAAASEGAVSAARAARLSGELSEAHAEIRRLSELEGKYLLFSMHSCPGIRMHDVHDSPDRHHQLLMRSGLGASHLRAQGYA